jgi:hypothetical protein
MSRCVKTRPVGEVEIKDETLCVYFGNSSVKLEKKCVTVNHARQQHVIEFANPLSGFAKTLWRWQPKHVGQPPALEVDTTDGQFSVYVALLDKTDLLVTVQHRSLLDEHHRPRTVFHWYSQRTPELSVNTAIKLSSEPSPKTAPDDSRHILEFRLADQGGLEFGGTLEGYLEVNSMGVEIHLPGYEAMTGGDGIIFLELYEGKPQLLVFDDITVEDPKKLSLDKARLELLVSAH